MKINGETYSYSKKLKRYYKFSDETRERMKKSSNHTNWTKHPNWKPRGKSKDGYIPWIKGKHHTKEAIEKMSKSKIGHIPWNKGIKGLQPWHDISGFLNNKGEKSSGWKGGVTPINQLIRTSKEYKLWRIAVFERDNYTCRFCGIRGTYVVADHIKPFAYYPELRFAIDNGRTLCKECHKTTDTYAGKGRWQYEGRRGKLLLKAIKKG